MIRSHVLNITGCKCQVQFYKSESFSRKVAARSSPVIYVFSNSVSKTSELSSAHAFLVC